MKFKIENRKKIIFEMGNFFLFWKVQISKKVFFSVFEKRNFPRGKKIYFDTSCSIINYSFSFGLFSILNFTFLTATISNIPFLLSHSHFFLSISPSQSSPYLIHLTSLSVSLKRSLFASLSLPLSVSICLLL